MIHSSNLVYHNIDSINIVNNNIALGREGAEDNDILDS